MTVSDAIKYMEETGKPVINVKRPYDSPGFNGYFQLSRNGTILRFMPETACAAKVTQQYTESEFESLGKYHTFEPYEKPA